MPSPDPAREGSRPPLVRESRSRQTGPFAPAVLGVAATVAFAASLSRGSAALRILAGLLGAAALLVAVMAELSRTRGDPARRTGTALGLILTGLLAAQPFTGSVDAFLRRAFGAEALGVPITVVAAAAIVLLFGPALVLGFPSLIALTAGAARAGFAGGRATLLLWLSGLSRVPEPLRADRDRARIALAWLACVLAGWIGYTAWRGI